MNEEILKAVLAEILEEQKMFNTKSKSQCYKPMIIVTKNFTTPPVTEA